MRIITPPQLSDRALKARPKAEYELSGESIEQFNAIARKVMEELKVPVNDLNGQLADKEFRERVTGADGTHFSGEGSAKLGKAVAEFVQKYLPTPK